MTAALTLAALILWPAPAAPDPPGVTGYASAYAPGVFREVVNYRLDNRLWRNIPPSRWIYADGYVATNDCAQVGLMLTLIDPAGQTYDVLVADCGGDDGGAAWMTANNIIAELDWNLWTRLVAEHGRPLRVTLR